MNEIKKPFYKRWWFIGIVALLVMGLIGNALDPVEEKESQPKTEEAAKPADVKPKPAEKKEEKPKTAPKSTVEKLKASNKVDNALLENGVLTIESQATSYWDETGLLKDYVYDLFEEMAEGFKDGSVDKVHVIITTKMVYNKGNESVEEVVDYEYNRATFEELNYDKFSEMAYSESWRILNEADTYWIHAGIYTKVKDDFRKNLTHGPSKQ